jgi:hypothetical protein
MAELAIGVEPNNRRDQKSSTVCVEANVDLFRRIHHHSAFFDFRPKGKAVVFQACGSRIVACIENYWRRRSSDVFERMITVGQRRQRRHSDIKIPLMATSVPLNSHLEFERQPAKARESSFSGRDFFDGAHCGGARVRRPVDFRHCCSE